jgi:hypothetical protein
LDHFFALDNPFLQELLVGLILLNLRLVLEDGSFHFLAFSLGLFQPNSVSFELQSVFFVNLLQLLNARFGLRLGASNC